MSEKEQQEQQNTSGNGVEKIRTMIEGFD